MSKIAEKQFKSLEEYQTEWDALEVQIERLRPIRWAAWAYLEEMRSQRTGRAVLLKQKRATLLKLRDDDPQMAEVNAKANNAFAAWKFVDLIFYELLDRQATIQQEVWKLDAQRTEARDREARKQRRQTQAAARAKKKAEAEAIAATITPEDRQRWKQQEIDRLQQRLDTVLAKIQRNNAATDAVSGTALNPAGDIGGIRSRSPKRKQQIFDRRMKLAQESVRLYKQKAALEKQIAAQNKLDQVKNHE